MAQQIVKEVDKNFKSFFSLLKLAQKGEYVYKACKYFLEVPTPISRSSSR